MKETLEEAGAPADLNPSKPLINTVVALGRVIYHPKTYFEDEAAIREHRDQGGVLYILMTHFNRFEPGMMAQLACKHKSLRHIKYTTGVTARKELWDIPGLGHVLRNINAAAVERVTERPNVTPEEKKERQEENQRKQAIAGRYLAQNKNWIIWPEGSTREDVKQEDGEKVRIPRDIETLLPIRRGFVYSLEAMTEEERKNVKLLAIASYFGERALSVVRPTVHIGRPTAPIEGTTEEVRQQGEDLLQHSFSEAKRLDALRRF
jgi:hypothetical protein